MVVLILSISVAIVTPRLMDLGEVRAKGAMRRFQGTVRYLYNESVFRKKAFLLNIDIEKGEYWVETPQVDGATVENVKVQDTFVKERSSFPATVRITDVQSPRLGKRSDGVVVVRFFPHGFVEPTTIHIEDHNKNKFTLFIQPVTGTVKILPGHVEITRKA